MPDIYIPSIGEVTARRTYVNSKLHGVKEEFWPHGVKKSETNFINGKRHGKHTEWWRDGSVKLEEMYENGEKVS